MVVKDIDKGNMLFYDARVSTIGGKITLADDYSIENIIRQMAQRIARRR